MKEKTAFLDHISKKSKETRKEGSANAGKGSVKNKKKRVDETRIVWNERRGAVGSLETGVKKKKWKKTYGLRKMRSGKSDRTMKK